MLKNYYIIFLLISLSLINTTITSPKNLRQLQEKQEVTYSEINNLRYDESDNKVKFDIVLEGSQTFDGGKGLTIIYKNSKVTATCNLVESKLICEYSCDQPFYGLIQIPKSSNAQNSDNISLNLNQETTLYQTVKLTFQKAYVEFSNNKYTLKVYVLENTLKDNGFYQLNIKFNNQDKIANCTYSTTDGFLKCGDISGNQYNVIKLVKENTNNPIQWENDETYDFEKNVLLKLTVTNIYGYNLEYDNTNKKWKFWAHATSSNVEEEGYYYAMNILINKGVENTDIKALAYCQMTEKDYYHKCSVDSLIDAADAEQAETDLVYISNDQVGATITLSNGLTEKKIMSSLVTLTFEKAYGLKFEDRIWKFKIEISDNGLRDGLNVTIDLYTNFNSGTYYSGSCVHNQKILSCIKDTSLAQSELVQIDFSKEFGTVTWRNSENLPERKKIPLEISLTYKKSYYLKYIGDNDETGKWTFKIDVEAPGIMPKDSLTTVDIISDSVKCLAECGGNNETSSSNKKATLTCECNLAKAKIPQISSSRESGSITWTGLTDENSVIAKKIEFQFIEAYNLEYTETPSKKWSFDIIFADPEAISPTTENQFSLDIGFKRPSSTILTSKAECSLKENDILIFSCHTTQTESNMNNYLYYIKPEFYVDSKTINWIEGITDNYQIALKDELNFVKGTLNYETNSWILNIDISNPSKEIPNNSRLVIDITKDGNDETIECKGSSNKLKCDTGVSDGSHTSLPKLTLKRLNPGSRGVTWKNDEIDETSNYFYLTTNLNFISVNSLTFSNNKWGFNLETSDFTDKTKIKIDILYDGVASTATCIKSSSISCTVDKTSQSKSSLVKISHSKTDESTITWNNLSEDKDFIFEIADLTVLSVKHLSYNNDKWEFKMNLQNCELPINSLVQIDIKYKIDTTETDKTATCIHKTQNILTCVPDVETQTNTDEITILSTKNKGSVSYSPSTTESNLEIKISKTLQFEKVSELSLIGNNWEFKINLINSNLKNNENIEIDIKFNGEKEKVECQYEFDEKILTCTKTKTNNRDRIILINNDENQDLVWNGLNDDIELYVLYDIKFINNYGGFHDNKWKFNMKYEKSDSNTIDFNNNYASLDILVNNNKKIAKCKITEKFLICDSQHTSQTKDDIVKLYGVKESGTISFSQAITEDNKSFEPIDIKIENAAISDFSCSNDLIKFKIQGNLKENREAEIAENTITLIQIIITKKAGTKNELNTVCLTNEIKTNNDNVILSCETSGIMNKAEDNVDIKVDTNGKSQYVTFDSKQDNIKVYDHETDNNGGNNNTTGESEKAQENTSNKDKNNNCLLMKVKYLFLFGLILLF